MAGSTIFEISGIAKPDQLDREEVADVYDKIDARTSLEEIHPYHLRPRTSSDLLVAAKPESPNLKPVAPQHSEHRHELLSLLQSALSCVTRALHFGSAPMPLHESEPLSQKLRLSHLYEVEL